MQAPFSGYISLTIPDGKIDLRENWRTEIYAKLIEAEGKIESP